MISVADVAEEFNEIPTAKVENVTIEEWAGAESHYYSPKLAKEYGREGAIVLRGLAWKIKRSKNPWDGGKGYYETLENLSKLRFPYLSPSGLWNITTDLARDPSVLKRGTNNKRQYDRTTWYAMSDDLIRRALDDEGALGFDVKTAMSYPMPEALAVHHVHYHQRESAKKGNQDLSIRVNKKHLARTWGVDYATVKRAFEELVDDGILLNPKPKHYTIFKSGASVNESGAFINCASVNQSGASLNESGASVNESGASVNDYTHSEPIRKPFNHSNDGGRAPLHGEPCKSNHSLPATDSSAHQDVSTKQSSSTVPVKEKADTDITLTTFADLTAQNKQLIPAVEAFAALDKLSYEELLADLCEEAVFLSTPEVLNDHIAAPGYTKVMAVVIERFKGILEGQMNDLMTWRKMSYEELWPLLFYPGLEILVRAFQMDAVWGRRHLCTIEGHHVIVDKVNDYIMERRENDATSSAERKVNIFKQAVELRNKHGWNFKDFSVETAVCITAGYMKQIGRVFELNPHLAPSALIEVLGECIWWSRQPGELKERHYWSRRGTDLGTFCRKLDLIVTELDMREECPVTKL